MNKINPICTILLLLSLIMAAIFIKSQYEAERSGTIPNEAECISAISNEAECISAISNETDSGYAFLLPEIHVTSYADISDIDKNKYKPVSISISNAEPNNCIQEVNGYIKGRGNSTWIYFEKKPYKLKFEEDQNLFGMGMDKDWILLSNALDHTLMRNEIAFGLGHILGLDYTPECQWIHFFYNEEYQGIYLICEQVETGLNRVNIETSPDSNNSSFSFMMELGGDLSGFTLPAVEGAAYNWGEYFICEIMYPDTKHMTSGQINYVIAYMQSANEAILKKDWDFITELLDVESLVNWYLVNEIMLNGDMGWSMYAYKPLNDKMYLGPIWDFDQCCGVSVNGGADYGTWYPESEAQNAWFNTLIEMDAFKTLLAEQWSQKRSEIISFLEKEREKANLYETDIEENFRCWPVLGTSGWRIRDEIVILETYEEQVNYLFQWLDHRIEWLDEELGSY